MPSPRCFPSTVSVSTKTWANNKGERASNPTTTTAVASVQPMRVIRRQVYGLSAGETAWTVFFPSDPGVDAEDVITWQTRKLQVFGPARDEAGRGVLWAVDCRSLD